MPGDDRLGPSVACERRHATGERRGDAPEEVEEAVNLYWMTISRKVKMTTRQEEY